MKDSLLDKHDLCHTIDLSWQQITYNLKQKPILSNLTGISFHSSLTAIMGASGAGKTSLLNVLSCRTQRNVEGSVYANNMKMGDELFGKIAGYVVQEDILMDTLTPIGFLMGWDGKEGGREKGGAIINDV